MQWYKIRKEDVSQDLCISDYALEELTPVAKKIKELPGSASPYLKDPEDNQHEQIGGRVSNIEREAYERGFASGEEAGRELGLKEMEGGLQRLKQVLDALNHYQEKIMKQSEEDILVLVLAVAHRIIEDEYQQNEECVKRTITKAIQIIGRNESITIRIHPETLEKLKRDHFETSPLFEANKNLLLEADDSFTPGECVVESKNRVINARIENRISILAKALSATKASSS